ncbi:MAG: SAM-dependent chlorinase/fluorinase [Acidobacteriota bacterium]
MARKPLIVLLSDLGTRDPSIAQTKAAILNVNRDVEIVDATHEIRPRDLLEAGFHLERIYRNYPTRTIFCVMVEQFRGARARPLLVVTMDNYYFAPDNGVLSFLYQSDPPSNVYHVTAEHYIKEPIGPVSGHRDVYGSAAGWLTKGIESNNFGDAVDDYVRTQLPTAQRSQPNELKGHVLHVDRHGGLVTNLTEAAINAMRQELGAQVPFQLVVGQHRVPILGGYADGGPEVFGVFGNAGFVEIVGAKADASAGLGAKRGDAVAVQFGG